MSASPSPAPSHETPLYLVVPASTSAGDAMRLLLSSRPVLRHWMPPLWCLDRAGIDLPAALPDVTSITLGTLPQVVDTLIRLATRSALDDLVLRMWPGVDEQVRRYYLRRGLGQTLATIFRMAPRSHEVAPPPAFRQDRIAENGFQVEYRIAPSPGERNVLAPTEEATVVLYPFDPGNEAARREIGLGPGAETVLEVFAYAEGRARHRAVLEEIARPVPWRVIDPS
jgi:hypothetical protein